MEIRRIAADDSTAVEAWFQLRLAWAAEMPVDPGPCRAFHNATLTHPWPDEEDAAYLASVDGEPIGFSTAPVHHVAIATCWAAS